MLTLLFILACLIGFATFRFYYNVSVNFPFTQEFILVLLGVISTVLITAILLIQQSKLDLRKEEKVILLGQKNAIYMGIIETITRITDGRRFDREKISHLKVLNHKLSLIGSVEVVINFNRSLDLLIESFSDEKMSDNQAEEIMHSIAELTFHMRGDLIGYDAELATVVREGIISNSKDVEIVEDKGELV